MFLQTSSVYIGQHLRNRDEKSRITLPSKWRFPSDEGQIYVAIPNPSGCITVYPPKMVSKLEEKVSAVSLGDKVGQKILTKLFSRADQLVCDSQGRVIINDILAQHAKLEKEVTLVGNFVTFSIWAPDRYEIYISSEGDEEDELSKILTQLGL